MARSLLLDRSGNRNIGLMVLGDEAVRRGESELPELIERKSLQYVYLSMPIGSESSEKMVDCYSSAAVFACTKDFLLCNYVNAAISNQETDILNAQIDAIIDKEITTIVLPSLINWETYKEFKNAMYFIKSEEYSTDKKDEFIIHAYSLMKLFMTAAFSIRYMEKLIDDSELENVIKPDERLTQITEYSHTFPDCLKSKAETIINILEIAYLSFFDKNPKEKALKELLEKTSATHIAIVVPKAYYIKLMQRVLSEDEKLCNRDWRIDIVTANRFDNSNMYDLIIAIGNITGNRFDILRCQASKNITAILYEAEKHQFHRNEKRFKSVEHREVVDLIWFPTGGGKTEAYLGLTAFTIFYRRLAHFEKSKGTAVIMRYTLRLLAAQQFTRASTLICACEYIRNDATSRKSKYGKYPLGDSAISIGLWIGNDHIPNTDKDAQKYLQKLLDASPQSLKYVKEQNNKFQVLKCPWCGTKMVKDTLGKRTVGTFGYRMRNNKYFELFCPQESCFFNQRGKLPIQIIDQELYVSPPTLLFGTVDKFAMMPWKREIGSFFAVDSENRTPDLIIQDELHLISGPLGTMVGLYESAIDLLCKSKGVSTKVIASTATIRRAKEQCAALYNRDVSQFPHPGLDAEDSFFARESKINYSEDKYGRKYIGMMPSGKTKAMMEIRAIAALMQKINTMKLSDEIKDKFWTLTVYFNSLKDLGKCTTLVDDDVKDFIKRTAYRLGDARDARVIARADELTSRVSTTQLNETLDKLEKMSYSKENIENRRYPSNILLATNMISVGIDVARLNVMLLVGQPKLTSEYIQASSRVGRSFPGVAFTMYDGSKSRDRSHYEQFKPYHESFYKYVEPTGATPFSKPARDRALHAVIIALMRMLEMNLTTDESAGTFVCADYKERIKELEESLSERAAEISVRINPNMTSDAEETKKEIADFFEEWEKMAECYDENHFYYGEKFMLKAPADDEGRLMKVFNTGRDDSAYDTMTSMRNVDSSVRGNVLVWEED